MNFTCGNESLTPSLQNEDESGLISHDAGSDDNSLPVAAQFYSTLSALLDSIDQCSDCFRQWVGTDPHRVRFFRERIDQWKAAGRPELKWPQKLSDAQTLSTLGKSN